MTSGRNSGTGIPTLHARSSACTTMSIAATTKKSSVGNAQFCQGTYVVGPASSIAECNFSRARTKTATESPCPAEPNRLKSSRIEVFSGPSAGAASQSTSS